MKLLNIFAVVVFSVFFSIAGVSADTISSCPTTISSSGTYTLTGDLSSSNYCIKVDASNVVINCGGHKITGTSGTTNYGISGYNGDVNNVTINDCIIDKFGDGIVIPGGDNWQVNNVVVANSTSNYYGGIYISGSANYNNFNNVEVYGGIKYGVYIYGSSNNNFTGLYSHSNSNYDIYLTNSGSGNYFDFINFS